MYKELPPFEPPIDQLLGNDRLISLDDLCGWFDIGRTTYYRWRHNTPERLPASLPGYDQPRWRVGDVRTFLRNKNQERSAQYQEERSRKLNQFTEKMK